MDNTKELAIKTKIEKDYPEFVSTVEALPLERLEKNLAIYAKYREETELSKQKDQALQRAKENVKELAAPYNDSIKALKLKTAYLNILIEEAKEVDGQEKE